MNDGIFELLQGNRPTGNSLVIDAIGEAQRFWPLGGEPRPFTLVPNFLISGIASMIVGVAIVIWSIWFLPIRHGRTVFLGLFTLSFLVGGGIGQVAFFVPAWAFATRMDKPLTWWKKDAAAKHLVAPFETLDCYPHVGAHYHVDRFGDGYFWLFPLNNGAHKR